MSASLFGRGARTTPSRILDLQENSHEHCSNLIIKMVLLGSEAKERASDVKKAVEKSL